MVLNDYLRQCQYHLGDLDNTVYFQPFENDIEYVIDKPSEPYCAIIYDPLKSVWCKKVELEENSMFDGNRFNFNYTLTLTFTEGLSSLFLEVLSELKNKQYRAIVKTKEGMYYLVNAEYPYTLSYNYTWNNSSDDCVITLSCSQNMPTMKVEHMERNVVPLIERYCGYCKPSINEFDIIETRSVMVKHNDFIYDSINIASTNRWKHIEPLRNSFNHTSSLSGDTYDDIITFRIELSDYLTTFHYNLIEFVKNRYTIRYKTSHNNSIVVEDLFPSFSLETNEDLNIITITLRKRGNDSIHYNSNQIRDIINTDIKNGGFDSTEIVISGITFPSVECISPTMAKRIILPEIGIDGEYTGMYYVLEGYEGYFAAISDIIKGTYNEETINDFDVSLYFYTSMCADSGCLYSTTLNDRNHTYSNYYSFAITAKDGWEIIRKDDCLSFSQMSGNDTDSDYVMITSNCDYGVESEFTIKICDKENTYKLIRLNGDNCFINKEYEIDGKQDVMDIDTITVNGSAHTINFSMSESEVLITNVPNGLTATTYGRTLTVKVPERETFSMGDRWYERLEVQTLDGRGCDILIIQNPIALWYKTDYDNYECDGTTKYYMKRLYSGYTQADTPTDIYIRDEDNFVQTASECMPDAIIDWVDTDDYYCEESGEMTQWSASTTEYVCDGVDKYSKEYFMVSQDGINWTQTSAFRMGNLIEKNSTDCGGKTDRIYRWIDTDETMCDGVILQSVMYKEYSDDKGHTWIRTDETTGGEILSFNTIDCGGTGCTVTGETIEKWEDDKLETMCVGLELHYVAYKYTSCNSGLTWNKTSETKAGTLIYKLSIKCGGIEYPIYEWREDVTDQRCYDDGKYTTMKEYVKYSEDDDWVISGKEKKGTRVGDCDTGCTIEYKWIDETTDLTNTICDNGNEYYISYHYWSDDCWETKHLITEDGSRKGSLYKENSDKCTVVQKWVYLGEYCGFDVPEDAEVVEPIYSSTTEVNEDCDGITKVIATTTHYYVGLTPNDFVEYSAKTETERIEHSEDCGYIPEAPCETKITYTNGSTSAKTINGQIYANYGFSGKTNIRKVEIGSCVTIIGNSAFTSCQNITSVSIPNTVTKIGDYAFNLCEKLTSVTIPDSVTSIGEYAFAGCQSITSITIPDTVKRIDDSTFWVCLELSSVTIGSGVTFIERWAFRSCASLKHIYYNGTIAQWKAITKYSGWNQSVPTSCVVHCTDGDTTM